MGDQGKKREVVRVSLKDPPLFSGKREEYDEWAESFETVMRVRKYWK